MAASSGAEEEENNNPAAYNASIYLMVGMPYLLFSIFGFAIYRSVKSARKNNDPGDPDQAGDDRSLLDESARIT